MYLLITNMPFFDSHKNSRYLCTYEHYCKYWNSYNCQSTCTKWTNLAFSSFAEKVYAQKTFANHPSQG